MSSNTTDDGKEVIQTTVYEPVLLKDQKSPKLSDTLDAQGNDVKGVADLECETINGKDVYAETKLMVEGLSGQFDKKYADRDHSHPEFQQLADSIDAKIEASKPTEKYAMESHTHDISEITGDIPLGRISRSVDIESLLTKQFSDVSHSHADLESSIESLDNKISTVIEAQKSFLRQEDIEKILIAFHALEDSLTEKINAVRAEMPQIKSEMPELIAIGKTIIPQKLDKKAIETISSKSSDGSDITVVITRAGEIVKKGSVLSTDDILLFSPASALVRLSFS